MIALDSNVLLRLLTGDDPAQRSAALTYLRDNASAHDPAWIGVIVLVEVVWTLRSAYRHSRVDIANAVFNLLHMVELRFEALDEVRTALSEYRNGADFSDALIGERNRRVGCRTTVTFDHAAAEKLRTHTLLA